MPRTANYEASLVGAAKQAVCTAKTIDELRQAQSILLPSIAKTTLSETGKILGISRANVWCLQKKFRNRIECRIPVKSNWGGRRFAERGYLFSEIMKQAQQPTAWGEVMARINDLHRVTPQEDWPFYDAQFYFTGVFARFQSGTRRVEIWDPNATVDFESMHESLCILESTASKIPDPGLQAKIKYLHSAWNFVCQGETHHAKALRYLFEKGNTLQAKKLLEQASGYYKSAEEAFAQAAYESKGMATVMERGNTETSILQNGITLI